MLARLESESKHLQEGEEEELEVKTSDVQRWLREALDPLKALQESLSTLRRSAYEEKQAEFAKLSGTLQDAKAKGEDRMAAMAFVVEKRKKEGRKVQMATRYAKSKLGNQLASGGFEKVAACALARTLSDT